MKVEIIKDNVRYNSRGVAHGHKVANKGDIVDVPFPVGKTLIDIGKAKKVGNKPVSNKVVSPSEAKHAIHRGAGWYDVFKGDKEIESDIRGRDNLNNKYPDIEVRDA